MTTPNEERLCPPLAQVEKYKLDQVLDLLFDLHVLMQKSPTIYTACRTSNGGYGAQEVRVAVQIPEFDVERVAATLRRHGREA